PTRRSSDLIYSQNRQEKPLFLELSISHAVFSHPFSSSNLKPDDIVAVMHNSHLICIFILHSQIFLMPCGHNFLPFYSLLIKYPVFAAFLLLIPVTGIFGFYLCLSWANLLL